MQALFSGLLTCFGTRCSLCTACFQHKALCVCFPSPPIIPFPLTQPHLFLLLYFVCCMQSVFPSHSYCFNSLSSFTHILFLSSQYVSFVSLLLQACFAKMYCNYPDYLELCSSQTNPNTAPTTSFFIPNICSLNSLLLPGPLFLYSCSLLCSLPSIKGFVLIYYFISFFCLSLCGGCDPAQTEGGWGQFFFFHFQSTLLSLHSLFFSSSLPHYF